LFAASISGFLDRPTRSSPWPSSNGAPRGRVVIVQYGFRTLRVNGAGALGQYRKSLGISYCRVSDSPAAGELLVASPPRAG
jgi:hypothetical protein